MRARLWLAGCFTALALFACGDKSGGGDGDAGNGDGDGGNGTIDAGFGMDAPFSGMCTPGSSQCSNCVDDDGDTRIDGFDAECSGPLDNDESSFKTGIPGDNIDATDQDCFFDGNSGSGNDGCSQHTCCLLQAGGSTPTEADDISSCAALAPSANAAKYDRNECYVSFGDVPVPQKCIDVCGGITPPGCDCFGCCQICNGPDIPGTDGCRYIDINPAVSPNCQAENIMDPGMDGDLDTADDPCKRCYPNDACGTPECGGATCILCPGQDPDDLPAECGGGSTCPTGITECNPDGSCTEAGTYCSSGCCIGTIL